ncbi:MAG: peptide chain release factor N(5)-glutamine methyltransferase [Patescibacteria group bacterium]|jgi:release factor glutamine methyltransferase|nr:peptide chain release factor N(5)-glutamine methyltransferase [Patescibacteria group bacterium]
MTIQGWIERTKTHFADNNIDSAWLDAVLILEFASGKDRAWLMAHSDDSLTHLLTIHQLEILVKAVARRANHEPIAYITGYKEFYGHTFKVNNNVLIPRPESEDIINVIADFGNISGKNLVDIGTGCGALAISAKIKHTKLNVTGLDISQRALDIAKHNAKQLDADVNFIRSNLLDSIEAKQDIILANLPYIPPDYNLSADIKYEPAIALYSDNGGLMLIEHLLKQAAQKLNPGGFVVLESLPSQVNRINKIATKHDLQLVKRTGLVQVYKYWP